MCPLLKALLLPASPPCVRSFACRHKTCGVPSVPGCLENEGVRAGSTHLVGVITLQVAGALRLSLGTVCVSVCACMSLCCASWIWGLFLSLPLVRLYATAKTLQTPWAESRTSLSQPRIQGLAVWSCGAAPGGAAGTTELCPCSHCPAWLDAGMQAEHSQGCQQGRSTQKSLQALAVPKLCEEWAAAALDVSLSRGQWLFPPLIVAPCQQPGHLSQQSPWPWMLGSISHHREMVGFGTLILGLAHATSLHKRGTLVPRHCRHHSSWSYAERRGTWVWPLVLYS